ncbi:MAG: BlaI/MecI/CopY family transcriptional regulator [Bacteroidetes bacterium]|nr:BlaI/MecI/CopY family transcriptional regulator [Bacteroidales bacterium]MBU1011010.1 BlaI/MecI/CopY family transcriptional regulator [Bacteroidota bacterium]
MNDYIKPTESELEILQLLWEYGPATVRQINDALNKKRYTGYTTTLKLLQIMAQKGIVVVDKRVRTHVYKAALQQEETQQRLVDQFLDAAFGGSAKKLVMQVLGNKKPSKNELDEIKSLITKLEGNKS